MARVLTYLIMELPQMNEDQIVHFIQQQFANASNVTMGIGDDAAVLSMSPLMRMVITNDALVEDVHFRLDNFSPEALAIKAIEVNLSDLAAMGATPKYLLLAVAIPPRLSTEWVERFSKAFCQHCLAKKIQLIGGDTTASPDKLFLSVTLLGEASAEYLKYRHYAKVGDKICVTGFLGDAKAGLELLMRGTKEKQWQNLISKQLTPQARIAEGAWLGKQSAIHAMMDLSDGLLIDLQRLLAASKVGARLDTHLLPLSDALQHFTLHAWRYALEGGEDYELLFTVAAEEFESLQKAYQQQFHQSFFCLGEVTAGKSLLVYHEGQKIALEDLKPFTHFGEYVGDCP